MMRKTREKAAVRPATQGGVTPEELALAGRSRAGRSLVKLTSAGVFTGRELLDAFAAVPERDYGRDRIRAGLFIWAAAVRADEAKELVDDLVSSFGRGARAESLAEFVGMRALDRWAQLTGGQQRLARLLPVCQHNSDCPSGEICAPDPSSGQSACFKNGSAGDAGLPDHDNPVDTGVGAAMRAVNPAPAMADPDPPARQPMRARA